MQCYRMKYEKHQDLGTFTPFFCALTQNQ